MSQIQSIYVPKTKEQLEGIYVELQKHQKKILEISKMSIDFYGGKKASNPEELKKSIATIDKLNKKIKEQDALLKKLQSTQGKVTKTAKQMEAQSYKQSRARQALNKQRERTEAQLIRENKRLEKTKGLYNRVQAGINSLTREYNDLAIRKELNGKLSAEEEISLGRLEGKLNKYQSALKKVDGRIGKHQRNVGNYKSTFDGLGFSIAQLSRELPAFANSMQTGFMAISNNIPMLVDEIGRLKQANVQLAASGKPTTNVLKAVGKAIFSLNGLLGIGITVLTVFGPKLIEWAFGMTEAEKATQKATEELEEQNKALKENIALRNRQINSIKEFINTGDIGRAFKDALGDADTERANLALIELAERLSKIGVKNADALKDQELSQRDRLNIAGNLLAIEEQRLKLDRERTRLDGENIKRLEIEKRYEDGKINNTQRGFELRKLGSTELTKTLEIQKRIQQLEEDNVKLIGRKVILEEKSASLGVSGTREKVESINLELETTENLKKSLEEKIRTLEKIVDLYPKGSKGAEEYTKKVNDLKIALGEVSAIDVSGAMAEIEASIKEADLSPPDDVESDWENTFSSIAGIVSQTLDIVDELNERNYNRQYARLEAQYQNSLAFAGDNVAARENIEEQYNRRKDAIARKQAQSDKETAIFNAVIDTATSIVKTGAELGYPAAIPFQVVAGALGAAQIALIASQSVPAYWQGGEVNGRTDILVNDDPFGKKGSNYKEVIKEPSGKLHFPQGKNVKMNVPNKSYVYPNYDAFLDSLDMNLMNNNILPTGSNDIMPMIVNNGLSKDEVMEVMNNHASRLISTINNKESLYFNYDERGAQIRRKKEGAKTRIMDARYKGIGKGV